MLYSSIALEKFSDSNSEFAESFRATTSLGRVESSG